MKSPHIPTFKWIVAMTVSFLLAFWLLLFVFSSISAEWLNESLRIAFGRWGIGLSYFSAVLAMNGLFHDGKVKARIAALNAEKTGSVEQMNIWNRLAVDLPENAKMRIAALQFRCNEIEKEFLTLSKYESDMKKGYWLAGAVLVFGTAAQLISLS